MTYIQHNSPFAKQKGGGTTKTCLPASKLRSMSKKQREKLKKKNIFKTLNLAKSTNCQASAASTHKRLH